MKRCVFALAAALIFPPLQLSGETVLSADLESAAATAETGCLRLRNEPLLTINQTANTDAKLGDRVLRLVLGDEDAFGNSQDNR
ncbi:MAG: hypothetical protein ACI8XO_000925 [Verrucomicrobiales bacterium]|jgi:hypothetical protein